MPLINTIDGIRESDELRKVEGGHENDLEVMSFVEYYDGETLVHRSVNLHLKTPLFADGVSADFS